MAFVAANVYQVSVHQTTKHSMTTCLLNRFGLKRLRINNMKLVAFASREY
jgi:hypothetical protein